jgi:hypothetical protein
MMKTIDDAKRVLRYCNAADEPWVYDDNLEVPYDICNICCMECTTAETLRWIWPELEGYNEAITQDEWNAERETP